MSFIPLYTCTYPDPRHKHGAWIQSTLAVTSISINRLLITLSLPVNRYVEIPGTETQVTQTIVWPTADAGHDHSTMHTSSNLCDVSWRQRTCEISLRAQLKEYPHCASHEVRLSYA